MAKYVICYGKNGDLMNDELETEDKDIAMSEARYEWQHLSDFDKAHAECFYLLESINPDEDAENHLDGNIICDFLRDVTTPNQWDAIANYMDDEIRKSVHDDLAPCTNKEFLREYLNRDSDFETILISEFGISASDLR